MLQVLPVHSLHKILPDVDMASLSPLNSATILQGERFSLQIAVLSSPGEAQISILSPLEKYIDIRRIALIPCDMPAYPDRFDDDYITTKPAFLPDRLDRIQDGKFVSPGYPVALWLMLEPSEEISAGKYPIEVEIRVGEDQAKAEVQLEIFRPLPPQTLIHTEWFHCDSIAQQHGVEVFSEKFPRLAEVYMRMAVKYGINMLLTPLFTPPLDTPIGGERMTVQLVDVVCEEGKYTFGFERLRQWVALCQKCGIAYYEMSHLFTQWGATSAPKIMGWKNGEYQRLFGWENAANSPEYKAFLDAFLPALKKELAELGIEKKCYFHISDEPRVANMEGYRAARRMVQEHLKGYPIIDALSDYALYEQGLVEHPIPANNHITPFLEHGVPELWTYYCCSQTTEVSNRFLAMPSARNRILGAQMYRYDIRGFLQWGFNYYYSALSKEKIDPNRTADGNGSWPAGDPFVVYPTEDGCVESLRLVVFYEGLQDMRAMQWLEAHIGREEVCRILDEAAGTLTFSEYPCGAHFLLHLRSLINERIRQLL